MGVAELIAGATFLWVLAIVAGSYYFLVVRPEVAAPDVLRQRIRTGGAPVRVTSTSLLKDVERLSAIGPLHNLLSGDNVVAARLRRLVHQAGGQVTQGGHLFLLNDDALELLEVVGHVAEDGSADLGAGGHDVPELMLVEAEGDAGLGGLGVGGVGSIG